MKIPRLERAAPSALAGRGAARGEHGADGAAPSKSVINGLRDRGCDGA